MNPITFLDAMYEDDEASAYYLDAGYLRGGGVDGEDDKYTMREWRKRLDGLLLSINLRDGRGPPVEVEVRRLTNGGFSGVILTFEPQPGSSIQEIEGEAKERLGNKLRRDAINALDKLLNDEMRASVLAQYCRACGTKNPACRCWDDS